MTDQPETREPRSGRNRPVMTVHTPGGEEIQLTLAEYRLALLGLVDFEGQWDALERATRFVVDGPAKAAIVHDRLLPLAEALPALLTRGIDALELLAARFWFRLDEMK